MTEEELNQKATDLAIRTGRNSAINFCAEKILEKFKDENDTYCRGVLYALGMTMIEIAREAERQLDADLEQFEQDIKQGVGDE